jgi:hypothetical protein
MSARGSRRGGSRKVDDGFDNPLALAGKGSGGSGAITAAAFETEARSPGSPFSNRNGAFTKPAISGGGDDDKLSGTGAGGVTALDEAYTVIPESLQAAGDGLETVTDQVKRWNDTLASQTVQRRENERDKRRRLAYEALMNSRVIDPDSRFRRRWDFVQMVLLVYVAFGVRAAAAAAAISIRACVSRARGCNGRPRAQPFRIHHPGSVTTLPAHSGDGNAMPRTPCTGARACAVGEC